MVSIRSECKKNQLGCHKRAIFVTWKVSLKCLLLHWIWLLVLVYKLMPMHEKHQTGKVGKMASETFAGRNSGLMSLTVRNCFIGMTATSPISDVQKRLY